ncbi:UNVERIFIED_CONTAM: Protein NLP6 [Sesamum indicum]
MMAAEEIYSIVPGELENCQEKYSISAFAEHLETKLCWSMWGRKHHMFRWIFWSPEQEELEGPQTISSTCYPKSIPSTLTNHGTFIKEKIKCSLQRIIECYIDYCLVQFWAPKTAGGRCFLTTSGQPFAVDWLCKGFCWYRKHCSSHDYLVDGEANEAELGPPGRVFQSGLPESSPDLRLYSTKEYPLRNQALSCGIKGYMALPVFDLLGQDCVGVLEFVVFSAEYINIVNEVEEGLKTADIRWTLNINQPCLEASLLQNEKDRGGQQLVLNEIKQMFEVLKRSAQLHLAQAWITSMNSLEVDNTPNSGTILMERAIFKVFVDYEDDYNSPTTHFLKACKLHSLIVGKGIVGRILATCESFFCPSVSNFSITEYPLVHYARSARLTVSFAICLQSSLTGDDIYVLEFFLLPGSSDGGYSWSFLPFLLTIMERQLNSFKVATGQLLGEELSVKAIEFCKDNGFDSFKLGHSVPYPLKFETLHYGEDMSKLRSVFDHLNFGCDVMDCSVEQNSMAAEKSKRATTLRPSKRERERTNFCICYEDLRPYFGKSLKDAEKGLGVSRSTLKRACRDHNITRWPSNEKNKVNPSLFLTRVANKSSPGRKGQFSMSDSHPPSDSGFVIVEADFEGDTMKFKLPFSSGMEKLEEEVARRLKLNVTSFRMKYLDGEGKWILLACDDDLQFCMETLASSGSNAVKMLVQSI